MATRYLYLIRHGQYDSSAPVPSPRHLEGELTKLGHTQAKRTAKALTRLPITKIHYSMLRRAEQTAQPLLEALPLIKNKRTRRLKECIPYVGDNTYLKSLYSDMPRSEIARQEEYAENAFSYYVRPTRGINKHEILYSHANLIRYFVCRALGVSPAAWINMDIYNCSITRILVDGRRGVLLLSYNDIGHLTPTMLTDNMHEL